MEPLNPKRSRLEDANHIDSSDAESDTDEPMPESTSHEDYDTTSTAAESSSRESSTTPARRKQASKFCNEWLKGREHWLKYLPDQGMFCALCQKHNKSQLSRGTWNSTPCTRLRLQSIAAHEGCAAHKHALKLESETLTTRRIQSALNPRIPAKGIEQAFTSLYFWLSREFHTLPILNLFLICWVCLESM